MLRREVWGYWYLTPPSGIRVDPDLSELRKPWADPVARENNMYSGHLLLMTSLYAMPFGGDVFEQAGSLSFHWNPLFWGMGDETFAYDNRSLQDAIIVEWKGKTGLVFVSQINFLWLAISFRYVYHGTLGNDGLLTHLDHCYPVERCPQWDQFTGRSAREIQAALEKMNMVPRNDLQKDWVC